MKKNLTINLNIIKRTLVAMAVSADLNSSIANAAHQDHDANQTVSQALLKAQPVAVYHTVCGKSLSETLTQIAQQTGITFKVNVDLGKDIVTQTMAVNDWTNAFKSILVGFNYATVQDGDKIKTVIITSRNGSAPDIVTLSLGSDYVDYGNLVMIESKLEKLPAKYADFPAGSVTPITLPIGQLMKVQDNTPVSLDLPMGQFNAVHDRTIDEIDGSKTWVGYLDDRYRMYLSQGKAGVKGFMATPDGSYNIEQTNGKTYLISTSQLKNVGFEGDSVSLHPTAYKPLVR